MLSSGGWTNNQYEEAFQSTWNNQAFRKIYIGDQLIGGIWVEEHQGYWQLREIQIEPKYQGKGIGTEVLLAEIERARSASTELRLRVLLKNKAISLYIKLGFGQVNQDENFAYLSYYA